MTGHRNRLALAALFVLVLTAFVTVASEVEPRRVDRCADPARLLDPTAIRPSSQPREGAEWPPVVEGRVARRGTIPGEGPREADLAFLIYRDWGLPVAMQNPGKAIPGRLEADRIRSRSIDVGGRTIPVEYADQTARNVIHFAMYVYAYDGRAVSSAFGTRMGSILHELLNGSPPITLLAVSSRARLLDRERVEAQAEEWIRDAWTHYLDACGFESVGGAEPDSAGDDS